MTICNALGRRRFALGVAVSAAGVIARHELARADAPAATIAVHAGGHWGHLGVVNTGPFTVFLQPTVVVEGLAGGLWHPIDTEMNLVSACDPDGVVWPLPNHVSLPAHASLTPPPWRGWSCNGQCERHCRNNTYWGAGPFRFRVLTSPAGRSFVSAPFAMPQIPTQPDDVL